MTNTKNKNKGNLFKGTCFDKMSKTRLIISKGEGIELKKGKRFFCLDLVYCILPNRYEGYRLEYTCDNKDFIYPEDIGTIIFDDKEKKWKIINW